ncbi:MAG: bioB, partial [Deltaproteobacteria bacterium]|nr:bioB [Deltaproteobacteria bacterium]
MLVRAQDMQVHAEYTSEAPLDVLAETVLAGGAIDYDDAQGILATPDEELTKLLHAAFRIRERHWGRRVKICLLRNARSGLCPEDCSYCS